MSEKIKGITKLVLGAIGFVMMCTAISYVEGGSENTPLIMLIMGLVGFYLFYRTLVG